VPLEKIVSLMIANGYTTEPSRIMSAREAYHRFTPPLGSRKPIIGVTAEGGLVRRDHAENIQKILADFQGA
jgi:hypothetical protein